MITLGDWLNLPKKFTHKTPVDGLQPKSDEEKLGFTYADLDKYIREDEGAPGLKDRIDALYLKNKFKTDIVHLPGPDFGYLGNFVCDKNLHDTKYLEILGVKPTSPDAGKIPVPCSGKKCKHDKHSCPRHKMYLDMGRKKHGPITNTCSSC